MLGENAERYEALAKRIAGLFNRRFLRLDGAWYDGGSLCEFVMPLFLDVVPPEHRQTLLDGLAYVIETKRGSRMLTGILGTKYTMDLLPRIGRSDLAWRLLTQTAFPSWGYMIAGQTTLCEDWSANEGGTLNQVMFGSVGSWLYQILGGIIVDASMPRDQRLTLAPYLPEGHRGIHASLELPQGRVASIWRRRGAEVAWQDSVPPNLTARLRFSPSSNLCEGGQPLRLGTTLGLHTIDVHEGVVEACVSSGDYAFIWSHS